MTESKKYAPKIYICTRKKNYPSIYNNFYVDKRQDEKNAQKENVVRKYNACL